ncbi:MAG: ATP-dependent helicase [Candidatus Sericytochromatia bacterium]|nr:ATP-dependent helicase [Candidatus Sericytochromatia bacterium]
MAFKPRKAQQEVLAYQGGELAISAVPGAGKTTCLVLLTTKLILQDGVRPSQILILTYTRAAAANIRERIRTALRAQGASAHGLKAQTIHSFCHELLMRRAGRLGFPDGFQIISGSEQDNMLQSALLSHLENPDHLEAFWKGHGIDLNKRGPDTLSQAQEVSRKAALRALGIIKNINLNLDEACDTLEGAQFGEIAATVRHYEEERIARGLLDYDDLIRLTTQLLEQDPGVLAHLQQRFRYVLEDEAQDSTQGQKRIIDQLVAPHHNLVRVGDSNQSIYATFTLNSPEFFRQFCKTAPRVDMCESSRSSAPILSLANELIHYTNQTYAQAFEPNRVIPAEDGSNPPAHSSTIKWSVHAKKEKEVEFIADAIKAGHAKPVEGRYMSHAILLAQNYQVLDFVHALEERGVPVAEGGAQGTASQMVVEMVLRLLKFLMLDGHHQRYRYDLVEAFLAQTRYRDGLYPEQLEQHRERLVRFIQNNAYDWRQLLSVSPAAPLPPPPDLNEAQWEDFRQFLRQAASLLGLRHLSPVDLITAIAGAFFNTPYQLSVAQAMSVSVRRTLYHRPDFRLSQVVQELEENLSASNFRERLFPAALEEISKDAHTQDPGSSPQPVRILTMHSAKGLEFDVVWLPSLHNNRDFPWSPHHARVDDGRVLEVDLLLNSFGRRETLDPATLETKARQAQVEERLRLLYVGITRARRFLRPSYCASDWYASKFPHLVVEPHIVHLQEQNL